jgi:6-bladed beta-propeller
MHGIPNQHGLTLPALALLAACGAKDTATARARVDTLPSGIVQVTSDVPTGWSDSAHAWKFLVTLHIQPHEGSPGELMEPGTLGVDDWGRIYVADRKPARIKVYDSAGTFVRTIGREGAGPGEYRVAYIAVRGAHLVVHDPMQSRTSVFDTSGSFIRSWSSSCCFWSDIGIDTADLAYIPTIAPAPGNGESRGRAYTRFRLDGTLVDTLFVPQRPRDEKVWAFSSGSGTTRRASMISSIPFTPGVTLVLHPLGGFTVGWSGEYRIMRSPRGEDTSLVITRAWTAEPIPEARRRQAVEEMVHNAKDMVGEATAREVAKLSDVPTTAPAFQTLRVDLDGNIWARHLVGSDSTRTRYDVFSPAGAWLGPVTVPVAVPEWGGQFFGRKTIFSTVEDPDGRPAIVRVNVKD